MIKVNFVCFSEDNLVWPWHSSHDFCQVNGQCIDRYNSCKAAGGWPDEREWVESRYEQTDYWVPNGCVSLGKGGCCLKHNQSRCLERFLMPPVAIYCELGIAEALIARQWTVPCYKSVRGPDLASEPQLESVSLKPTELCTQNSSFAVGLDRTALLPHTHTHTHTQTHTHTHTTFSSCFNSIGPVLRRLFGFLIWTQLPMTSASGKASVREKLEILIGQLLSMSDI
jgi:hypothetical protein